jgi:hypothetical protein
MLLVGLQAVLLGHDARRSGFGVFARGCDPGMSRSSSLPEDEISICALVPNGTACTARYKETA